MNWEIALEKTSKNKLNPAKAKEKVELYARVAERNKHLGFRASGRLVGPELIFSEEVQEERYRYLARIKLRKSTGGDPRVVQNHYKTVLDGVLRAAEADNWRMVQDQIGEETQENQEVQGFVSDDLSARSPFIVPKLTADVFENYFKGVYERDAHIRIIHDAAKSYMGSVERNREDEDLPIQRSHVLLKGKPAACKTTLFERFKRWFDAEGTADGSEAFPERVLFIDGPTLTKAGLENWFLDKAHSGQLPEFVVIEEVEKQDMNNLLSLISLMGSGYISKLNARRGLDKALANVVIWATCNDEDLVKNFRKGALWSRFTHRLHCPRPSQPLMHRIVSERVELLGGSPEWAERAMEFAYKIVPAEFGEPLDDPREILGLLDGGDRLLDFSYQNDLLEVMRSEHQEEEPSLGRGFCQSLGSHR